MIQIIKTQNEITYGINDYVIDTDIELQQIPTYVKSGSTAYSIESGKTFIKSNKGEWFEQKTNSNGTGGIAGEDGGYYIPFVDADGNLSWRASESDMPPVEAVNIKGSQGDSGVYVGSGEMPEGYNVQIDPTGDNIEIATKEYVDNLFNSIENGNEVAF